jgi:hypothetical protein
MGVEKTTKRGSLWFALITKYFSGDQIEKNEMGGAGSTYGREAMCVMGFDGETWGRESTWKTQA